MLLIKAQQGKGPQRLCLFSKPANDVWENMIDLKKQSWAWKSNQSGRARAEDTSKTQTQWHSWCLHVTQRSQNGRKGAGEARDADESSHFRYHITVFAFFLGGLCHVWVGNSGIHLFSVMVTLPSVSKSFLVYLWNKRTLIRCYSNNSKRNDDGLEHGGKQCEMGV